MGKDKKTIQMKPPLQLLGASEEPRCAAVAVRDLITEFGED